MASQQQQQHPQQSTTILNHHRLEKQTIPKSKRKLQKHLRSAGLAYISRTGKLIPAKTVAEELCQCPQKCDERVSMEAREALFTYFYELGDADLQNSFLRQNMDLRARLNVPEATTGTGRPPRRITCKYLVPVLIPLHDGIMTKGLGPVPPFNMNDLPSVEVCQKAFVSAFVITTKRVRLQREKLISSLGLNSYSSQSKTHNNNNNNNNNNHNNNNNNNNINICNNNNNNNHNAAAFPMEKNNNYLFYHQNKSPPALVTDLKRYSNGTFASSAAATTAVQSTSKAAEPKMLRVTENSKTKPKRTVDNPLIPLGLMLPDGVTIAPVTATPDHARDIAIVNNFFSNQLWKPEYIGTYS